MLRLLKLASYALFGYAVYELLQGMMEGHEHGHSHPQARGFPQRQAVS
jgi:hypothetical protein